MPSATKPSATTEEHPLTVARRAPTLAEQGEEGLRVVLKTVFSRVGLRAKDIPVGPEKALLHRDILKHYGGHTAGEVELAFEMAITDQLDVPPRDVQVYDQFTFAYFARIMNAYRRWAGIVARETQSPPAQRPPTPLELKLIDLDYACALAWMRRRALKPPLKP